MFSKVALQTTRFFQPGDAAGKSGQVVESRGKWAATGDEFGKSWIRRELLMKVSENPYSLRVLLGNSMKNIVKSKRKMEMQRIVRLEEEKHVFR